MSAARNKKTIQLSPYNKNETAEQLKHRNEIRRQYFLLSEKSEQDATFDDIESTLKQADQLIRKVKTPNEAVLDSSLFQKCAERTNQIIAKHDNSSAFNLVDFIDKLMAYKSNILTDSVPTFDLAQWKKTYGLMISHGYYNTCSPLDIMYGTFDMNEIQVIERIPRQASTKDVETEEERRPQEMNLDNTKDDNETTPREVEDVHRRFLECFKENKNKPLSYMRFVAHPNCFATTVQNMFHFSFLFKDNLVKFTNFEETFIAPQDVELDSSKPMEKYTTAVTITVKEWGEFIATHGIKEPMIKPKTLS